jgi:diacylglycerol diphosphate phosphatase / phosphatidate phosphatase
MNLNQLHFRLPNNHVRPPMTIFLRQNNVTRAPAYFVNFADCTLRRALAILYSVIDVVVTPFHQHFALQNYTLQYPYAVHERVPIALALAFSGLAPILVIALYTLVIDGLFAHRRKVEGYKYVYKFRDRLWELNCGILGLLLAQGAAFVITGTMKNLVGKPRPDLIDRCQPRSGSVDPPVFGLSSIEICTQTSQAILKDGM